MGSMCGLKGQWDRWKKYHMTNWKFQKEWKGDTAQGWQVDTSQCKNCREVVETDAINL